MSPQPENLGRGEARQRAIGDEFHEFGATSGQPFDFVAFDTGSLIVPEERWAYDLAVFVQEDGAVHLACQADARDGIRLEAGG
jgi:hypothetical protein